MRRHSLTRRTFLGGAAASPLVLSSLGGVARAADITVGIIYVGSRADYGWNQAHAVAAKALKAVPGVKVVEEENVPETVAVRKTMESMINIDGATLLFPNEVGNSMRGAVDLDHRLHGLLHRHGLRHVLFFHHLDARNVLQRLGGDSVGLIPAVVGTRADSRRCRR